MRVGDEHAVQPRRRLGHPVHRARDLYTPDEMRALAELAHARGLLVHIDGARLANAAAALGVSLRALEHRRGVDVLSFGGTKNGLLGGEAVVVLDPELADGFQYLRKQSLQLASKMRFLAAQFDALLTDELWLRSARPRERDGSAARRRGRRAPRRRGSRARCRRTPCSRACPPRRWPRCRSGSTFYVWDEAAGEVRWMCSWDTTEDDVPMFGRVCSRRFKKCLQICR